MLSLLEIIDNPRQDVPLIAVLRSPLFGFSAGPAGGDPGRTAVRGTITTRCGRMSGEDAQAFLSTAA